MSFFLKLLKILFVVGSTTVGTVPNSELRIQIKEAN